jgi:uncharacterized protein YecE (DUF72 family)
VPARLVSLAQRLPPGVRLGTSSWTFPGWAGIVYDRRAPESELARAGLRAYAAHPLLGAVGLDRTYYRPMTAAELRALSAVVPEAFRFVVKADRVLTSPVGPEPWGVRTPNSRFLDAAYAAGEVVGPVLEGLGERTGAIVFQFPPMSPCVAGGRRAFVERLGAFLGALPKGPIYAVELRTAALFTEAYARALDGSGAVHCYSVHPEAPPLARQLELLPPHWQRLVLVRWMLGGTLGYEAARRRYEPFDRLVDEDPRTRGLVARTVLEAALAEREAIVIANNKAEGSSPLTLFRLAEQITASDGILPATSESERRR